MQYSSSESEDDCIDDTGCEKMFEPTYWDISYFHTIEIDNGDEEDEEDEEDKIEPRVKEIQRYRHFEETDNGEMREIGSLLPEEEYSSSSYDSSSVSSSDDDMKMENEESDKSNDTVEFYDSKKDEKLEQWMKDHNHDSKGTDAILCCPSCFTTVCYQCKLLTDTVYNKIRSIREARKSDVFVSRTPCNIRIKEDKKIVQKNVGIPIECEVCGNQLGYKKDDDYIFMNLIEEDGVCYSVCSSDKEKCSSWGSNPRPSRY